MTLMEKARMRWLDRGDERLGLRVLKKLGIAKERAVGLTDAEEIKKERELERKRKDVRRRTAESDLKIEEMGILM